jgi:hypothetical protein
MKAKLCALVLLAACSDGSNTDTSHEPGTEADSSVAPRDAAADARRPDATVDARVTDARTTPVEDAAPEGEADAAQPPPKDAAVADAAVADSGAVGNARTKPVFVVVGYRGLRWVSRDLGLTWSPTATLTGNGDDENLLRAVAYHDGLFVAAGWKIWTSTDALTWSEHTLDNQQWFGGLGYGNDLFVGAGGVGSTFYSSDGIRWNKGKDLSDGHARSVAFGSGKFMAATDAKNWWSSTDGNNWTLDSGGHPSNLVVYCDDHFADRGECSSPLAHGKSTALGMNVYVSIDMGGNNIQRSTDGVTWQNVKQATDEAWFESVAFGLLP